MKSISLPPHAPTLIESTRAIGYTLEAAIADIIDNSISALASCIDVFFFPINEAFIAILDNGTAMNCEQLENAMRYGSQNPNDKREPNDLGRFGLGLKTASLSQCRILTVVSLQNGHIEARRWDIDYVINTGEWSLTILDKDEEINNIPCIEKLKESDKGTLVVWQNLDRLKVGELYFDRSMGRKMDDVRKHLSLVFHRYLTGDTELKKIQIRINNASIEPVDPFLTNKNTQVMADENLYIDDVRITVRPYILPHVASISDAEINMLGGKEGLRKSQGFYVYRNKRLLVWGTWFRLIRKSELSKLARIQVDIPNELDNLWTLDIKKSTAVPPEVVRNNLESIVERMAEYSKQTWVFRGKRETRDTVIHIWQRYKGKNGGFYYGINREHPLVEIFSEESLLIKKNIETLLKTIEMNIPLNQLYHDLNDDKKIENETNMTEHDVEIILKGLLDQMTTFTAKKELLNHLSVSEPFENYPHLIERYRVGVIVNEN